VRIACEKRDTVFRELNDSFRYTGVCVCRSGCIQRVPRRNEDVMDERQLLDTPYVESHDVIDEESTSQRQNAALRRQNAALLEDNEDLRASALWWKALYEESQRRCADLESSPKARVTSRLDVRFAMPSPSPARTPRPGATTRPL
jgi:hypothetical protein